MDPGALPRLASMKSRFAGPDTERWSGLTQSLKWGKRLQRAPPSRQAEDAGDDGVSVLRVWAGSCVEAGLCLSDPQLPAPRIHPGV